MYDDDPQTMAMCADMQEIVEGTHLVDGDLLAGLLCRLLAIAVFTAFGLGQRFGLQQPESGLMTLCQAAAGGAFSTDIAGRQWFFAQQRRREAANQFKLPHSTRARKQQGVRQLRPSLLQQLPERGMKFNYVH